MSPPPDYYVDHLRRVLCWVRAHHDALLLPAERAFATDFERLTAPARRLWVRLVLRRGPLFRVDRLAYPEVPDVNAALAALEDGGFAASAARVALTERLRLLTVSELRARVPLVPRKGRRCEIEQACLTHVSAWGEHDLALPASILLRQLDTLALYKTLFFANPYQDLTEFIVADVGNVLFESYTVHPRVPFPDRAALVAALRVHELADTVKTAIAEGEATTLAHARSQLELPVAETWAEARRARALLRLGRWQERYGCADEALACYRAAGAPGARERACRLLARRGRAGEARSLLQVMARSPRDPDERHFAASFDASRGRCRPRPEPRGCVVRLPRAAEPRGYTVESAVAARYLQRGLVAVHVENKLLRGLFGLVFWDIVFADVTGAFIHPFQLAPRDLRTPGFRLRRTAIIEARLQAVRAGRWSARSCLECYDAKYGVANVLVSWRALPRRLIALAVASIPPGDLATMFDRMSQDPGQLMSGLPDLAVLGGAPGCYELLEVKGPGDRLSVAQADWLHYLSERGIPARVVHAERS